MNELLLKRNEAILATEIDGELVMMSIEDGKYFGLNKTGTLIWKMLETPMSFEEICSKLSKDFNISFSMCSGEVKPFVDELVNEKVLSLL